MGVSYNVCYMRASVCECTGDKANAFRSSGASNQCLSAIYQAHGHFTSLGGSRGKSGGKNTLSQRLKSEWGRHRNSATKNRNCFVAFHRQKGQKANQASKQQNKLKI